MEDTSGNNVVFDLKDEAATINLAREISNLALTGDVIALFGDLGSGKTVFARAFINARTINYENVPSPTFTLLQTYEFPNPEGITPVYHFDLYRIESDKEIEELGMDDAFIDGISLVEWPERLNDYLPNDRLDINFTHGDGENRRQATVNFYGTWTSRKQSMANKYG
ncbi:MAG: tRNA (adenosine(37)-N6)-threonylcarbamoyltransferase complex ATPase subunit type 1 TsaE [Pseudomonadota bacterium]|nr:tRNA (adenosine(37)-N6)-threonylcarbamoyltransferase complex ATPase subunit type 1 TsaE [Pseudomonadota bacterium]